MGLKNKIWSTFFEEKNQLDNQNQVRQGINSNLDNNNTNNNYFQSNKNENQQNQESFPNHQSYILPTRQVIQQNNPVVSSQNGNVNPSNSLPPTGANTNNNQVPQYYNHNPYFSQPNNNNNNNNNNGNYNNYHNNMPNNMSNFNYQQVNQLPNMNQNGFLPQQNQVKYDIYGNYIGVNPQNSSIVNNQPIPFEQLNSFDDNQQNFNSVAKVNHSLVNNNINSISSAPIVYNGFDSFNKQNHDFNNQSFNNFSQYPNHNNVVQNNNYLPNNQVNQLAEHNINNVKTHNEKFSKKLHKHQLRNYQMPNEIASEIKAEKIRSFLILMFGFIGTIATILFITLYFTAKNQGFFEGQASDIAKNAIVGISVNSLPHPFVTFTLLIVSLGLLFGGTIDLLKVKKEANLYLANLIRGNNTIPHFIIENYKKIAVRSIILNWVAFPTYILGTIVLLILYGFQKHAGESFTVGFWKWGVVKDLTVEITINIILLISMLAVHILNIVSSKNRKSNIIGYYGYEIVSPDEMRQIKKRVNRNCLIVFIIIVMIILIAITLPIMIAKRKKESRWVWPWQARR